MKTYKPQHILIALSFSLIPFIAVQAGEVATEFTTGETLTATRMEEVRSAVNDNNARVGTNEVGISDNAAAIGNNATDIANNATAIGAGATAIGVNATAISDNATAISDNATAIGNNSTAITDNTTAIDDNATDISELQDTIDSTIADFDSSIEFQIPVLSTTAANTTVAVWLANESTTTCNAYLASRIDTWQVGANAKGGFVILPFYSTLGMPAKTITGSFPNITTTTTIVARTAVNSNLSASDYVDVTLFRSEGNASDTCNAGDISVRGALATYPGGLQYFVPVKEMVVR